MSKPRKANVNAVR